MTRSRILLRSFRDQAEIARSLCAILQSCSSPRLEVVAADSPAGEETADLVIEFRDLAQTADAARHARPTASPCDAPRIVVASGGGVSDRLKLLQEGAADLLELPLSPLSVLPRVCRLIGKEHRENDLLQRLKEKLGLNKLVGESPAFVAEIKRIPLAARCDATILITGDTGTGKEMVARAVHYLSRRAGQPFVPLSCGVVPVELAESELFGHEQGAFTGALSRRIGLVQEAHQGTLFLDDVDCLSLAVQAKLLRFLQEKEYRVLGSTRVRRADVRVIAASNQDLALKAKSNAFRGDLYYRLNVLPLCLPPLREREQDVLLLARHFLRKYTAQLDRPARQLSDEAAERLLLHSWPGNVRELENVIERAVVFGEGPVIQASDLDLSAEQTEKTESFRSAKAQAVAEFEKDYIQKLLRAHRGNISQAARAARKNRRAFWELIRKHDIDACRFKPGSRG